MSTSRNVLAFPVLRRIRPEGVVADLCVARPLRRRDAVLRRDPRVVEAAARGVPRRGRVASPGDDIDRALVPRLDLHHVEGRLVRVVLLHRVRDVRAVVRHAPHPEGGAPVGRPRRRIEQHLFRPCLPLVPIDDELLLARVPSREKPTVSVVTWRRHGLDVEELLETLGELVSPGKLAQKVSRQSVLRRRPRGHVRVLRVLEPAIGVGDLRSVDRLDQVVTSSTRVREHRGRGGRHGGDLGSSDRGRRWLWRREVVRARRSEEEGDGE